MNKVQFDKHIKENKLNIEENERKIKENEEMIIALDKFLPFIIFSAAISLIAFCFALWSVF